MENINIVPKKILCIEDDEMIRTHLVSGLQDRGYTTLQAENGEVGYKMALTEHPDLIVLDELMPIMNGLECLRKIREDETWGRNAHVVFFTNNDDIDGVSEALALNVTKYIIKSTRSFSDIITDIHNEITTPSVV